MFTYLSKIDFSNYGSINLYFLFWFLQETDEGENQTSNAFPVNTYVRVCGLIRAFGGKRTVNCHKMMAIPDLNELTCHMLEVIYASAGSQVSHTSHTGLAGWARM